MLTISQAFYHLKNKLQPLYDEREAAAIAHEVLQAITGLGRTDRLLQKEVELSPHTQQQFDDACIGLLQGRPMQYVLGTAWFMGRPYNVSEQVLIPRPETEELVQWIISDWSGTDVHIFDIGTGSGCIAISLKLALPQSQVSACDVSAGALAVAIGNAHGLGADVSFIELDFLNKQHWQSLDSYMIIVSNPPYIPVREKERIHTNVKDHEPSIALFVPDDDALLFYRAIAAFGLGHLRKGGSIYCELDADHAVITQQLFIDQGYKQVYLNKDIHGNLRMLKAQKD